MKVTKRIKYNRGSLHSAIEAARKIDAERFVYATSGGWGVYDSPPPVTQDFYKVVGLTITLFDYDHQAGRYAEHDRSLIYSLHKEWRNRQCLR